MEHIVQEYIESHLPKRPEKFEKLEAYALEHHVPIMEPYGMEVLLQWLRVQKPKRILEIGTAIGYSSSRIVDTLGDVEIVTIERHEGRYNEALQNIKELGYENNITCIYGDALEVGDEVKKHGMFDALFIDAAKGQYKRFMDLYSPLVVPGGIIYSDNILYKGYVATDETDDLTRRQRALIRKIQGYNEWLCQHDDYQTVILPVGDGIAISVKNSDKK